MSDFTEFLNSISSETIDLPKWINLRQKGGASNDNNMNEATSDNNMTQVDNVLSETTSDNNMNDTNDAGMNDTNDAGMNDTNDAAMNDGGMNGGEIQKLINMLVTENDSEINMSTETENLENQLEKLLQAGGAYKKKSSKKSAKKSSKKAVKKSSKKAPKKSSKKAVKKSSKKAAKKSSKKTVKKPSKKEVKKSSKKAVKKTDKKMKSEAPVEATNNEPEKPKRKANPALAAFAELSKHIATKLEIPNGPKAKKVAGAVKREAAEKFPDLSSVDVMKKSMEHFDNNMDKFKQML